MQNITENMLICLGWQIDSEYLFLIPFTHYKLYSGVYGMHYLVLVPAARVEAEIYSSAIVLFVYSCEIVLFTLMWLYDVVT